MIRLLLVCLAFVTATMLAAAEDRVVDLGDAVMVFQVGGPDAAVGKLSKSVIVSKSNVVLKMTRYDKGASWSLYAPGAGETPYVSLNAKTAAALIAILYPKAYALSPEEQKAMEIPAREGK